MLLIYHSLNKNLKYRRKQKKHKTIKKKKKIQKGHRSNATIIKENKSFCKVYSFLSFFFTLLD